MEIKIKNYLINTLNNGNKIYLCPLDKDGYNKLMKDYSNLSDQSSINRFIDKYGFKHTQIILDGDTYIDPNDKETVESVTPILSRILPHPKTIKNPITNTIEQSYKCFCAKPLNLEDVTSHKTPISSWDCLMIRIGEPEYAIVIEEKAQNKICI